MIKTITITSKDRPISEKRVNLSSLTDYQVETVTINAKTISNMFFKVDVIDSDMREIENAAIYDFLNFEQAD
jgi:hypothetical protein